MNDKELASYIFMWLTERNGGELACALDGMTVASRRLALEELTSILLHSGRPPSWA